MSLNRIGQTPVKTRSNCRVVLTKLGDNSLLALLYDKKAGAEPNQDSDASYQASANSSTFHVRLEAAAVAIVVTVTAAAVAARRKAVTPATGIFIAAKKAIQFAIEVAPQLV
jgi:hypothetical protein